MERYSWPRATCLAVVIIFAFTSFARSSFAKQEPLDDKNWLARYEYQDEDDLAAKWVSEHEGEETPRKVVFRAFKPSTEDVLPDGTAELEYSAYVRDDYEIVFFYWRVADHGKKPVQPAKLRLRPAPTPLPETKRHMTFGQVMVARYLPSKKAKDLTIREKGFVQVFKYEYKHKPPAKPRKEKQDWTIDGSYLPINPFYWKHTSVEGDLDVEDVMLDPPGLDPTDDINAKCEFEFNTWFFFTAALPSEPLPFRRAIGVLEWKFTTEVLLESFPPIVKTGRVTEYNVQGLPPKGDHLETYKKLTKRPEWWRADLGYYRYWPSD